MHSKAFENEFLRNLEMLSKEQQVKALAFIKTLLPKKKDSAVKGLLQFAGSIDNHSIHEMSEAINAGCENIDKNEW